MTDHLQLGEDSDYDKLSDMVKYLDLELHFGTQKPPSKWQSHCPLPSSFWFSELPVLIASGSQSIHFEILCFQTFKPFCMHA